MGRGFPSSPRRFQSQSLKVKILGVELISNTIALAPEQWMVPPGIKKWSCFLAGQRLTYFSASKLISPLCAARKSDTHGNAEPLAEEVRKRVRVAESTFGGKRGDGPARCDEQML